MPEEVLRRYFGYAQFRPGQRELIDAQLSGRIAAWPYRGACRMRALRREAGTGRDPRGVLRDGQSAGRPERHTCGRYERQGRGVRVD